MRYGQSRQVCDRPVSRDCVDNGIHLLSYRTPDLPLWNPSRPWVHQKRTEGLIRKYLAGGVDIVHGHSLHQYAAASECFRGKARLLPPGAFVGPVGVGGVQPRSFRRGVAVFLLLAVRVNHHLEHRCLAEADCITAFSQYTHTLLRQLHGKEIAGKTQVIPGMVDVERFQIIADRSEARAMLEWPVEEPVFFTLRRLVPRMGLDRLIMAAADVRAAGLKFRLMIGGNGPLLQDLERLTSALRLEDCVRFLGFVPEVKLPALYASADAFILPTAELECFGLIALESLACGRPVLATPVGAIPELVCRFEPRWLAEDSGATALARIMIDFLRGALPSHTPESLRQARRARVFSRPCSPDSSPRRSNMHEGLCLFRRGRRRHLAAGDAGHLSSGMARPAVPGREHSPGAPVDPAWSRAGLSAISDLRTWHPEGIAFENAADRNGPHCILSPG